ncbi:hypothetical protein T05_8775 [Trichinella murrelli]|uniref:Uncharacterized protein n=1 Tax=Trichinella murrelli TaxID=144512 RepID=A0A0V0U1I9_9BILA|nr:hypothetical protein T05_8775 [Trichinella murrelli]
MSVTGILQSHNRTPECLSLLRSCTTLFQHDIGKLLLAREHPFILPPLILSEWQAQTNVEVSCQAAYPLEQPLTIIMSTLRTC